MDKKRKIPSLDGLRAFAITSVIASHIVCARGFPGASRFAASSIPYFVGNLGVRVFFVISGFLITTLLLREEASTGKINIRSFLKRRAFRIAPVFFIYIFAIAVLCMIGILSVPWRSFLIAGTFTADFFRPHWYFGHFWSLSVEEQFYLAWPFVVARFSSAWRWRIATATFVCGAVVSSTLLYLGQDQGGEGLSSFTTIAAGCLLALARGDPAGPIWKHVIPPSFGRFVLVLTFMGAFLCPRPIRFGILAITVSVLIALAVDYLTRQRSWAYRVLNLGPIAYIGTLSYSLYIWQELYMRVHEFEHGPPFPLNLILAVASAVFSYHLIERPFIRLGRSGVRRPEREPGSDVGIDGDSIVLDSPLT